MWRGAFTRRSTGRAVAAALRFSGREQGRELLRLLLVQRRVAVHQDDVGRNVERLQFLAIRVGQLDLRLVDLDVELVLLSEARPCAFAASATTATGWPCV